MNARVERSIGLAVIGVTLLVGFVLMFRPQGKVGEGEDSVDSAFPKGRRALWLMLAELGFESVRWDESPNRLQSGHDVLWLSRVPTKSMPGERSSDEGVKRIGMHTLDHYRDFVEGGGTMILPASVRAMQFLAEDLGFEDCRSVQIDTTNARSRGWECTVRTHDDEELHVDSDGTVFLPLDPSSNAVEMWSATCMGVERPFAVLVPEGSGAVVLLAQDAWLRNEAIGKRDNATVAVRLVEQVIGDGRLLMDAYETGDWSPPSLLGLMFSPRFALVSLHVIACLALFVWMHAFARAFPRDREPLELFSPLVRARSLGGVLVHARRYPALATLMRRGTFAQLARRVPGFRFAPAARAGEGIVPASAAEIVAGTVRAPQVPDGLQRVTAEEVAAFTKAAGLRGRREELTTIFVTKPVLSRHDLDALDLDLDRIRREIEEHLGARSSQGESEQELREPAASGIGDTKGTG